MPQTPILMSKSKFTEDNSGKKTQKNTQNKANRSKGKLSLETSVLERTKNSL